MVLRKFERVIEDVDAAGNDGQDYHHGCRLNEADEVLVVSFAYAGTKPGAVVVQPLDAAIADAAVNGSWWSVNVAG